MAACVIAAAVLASPQALRGRVAFAGPLAAQETKAETPVGSADRGAQGS